MLAKTLSLSNLQFVFAIADKIQDEPFQSAPPPPPVFLNLLPLQSTILEKAKLFDPCLLRLRVSNRRGSHRA